MTLGFICSFIIMVFIFLFYAFVFVVKAIISVNKGFFDKKAIPNEESFIRGIRASDEEYKEAFDQIMFHYKKANRNKPFDQDYLIKNFEDDLRFIYGDDFKDGVSMEGLRARVGYFKMINFVNWFVALRLAKSGKAIPEWKDELKLDFGIDDGVNYRICQRIEYHWNQNGLDVHLEQVGKGRFACMKPSKFVYHSFDSPNYKW